MTKTKPPAQPAASLKIIQDQLSEFEETLARILETAKPLPEGELKEKLFYHVSCLDSIADVMRQALDACAGE